MVKEKRIRNIRDSFLCSLDFEMAKSESYFYRRSEPGIEEKIKESLLKEISIAQELLKIL